LSHLPNYVHYVETIGLVVLEFLVEFVELSTVLNQPSQTVQTKLDAVALGG
jgi:hypothetical protein